MLAAQARSLGVRAAALGSLGPRASASLAPTGAASLELAPAAVQRGWRSLLEEYGRSSWSSLQVAFAAASSEGGGEDLTKGNQDMGAFVAGKASSSPPSSTTASTSGGDGGRGGGPGGAPPAKGGGGGYALLAGAHAGLAATCFLAPTAVGNFFFPGAVLPQGFETQALTQLLGCGAGAGAAACFALKQAADSNALASPTAQRLQLGLMGFAGASIGLHAMYSPAISGTSLLAGAAVMGLTALVPYQHYVKTNGGLKPGEALRSYFGAIPDHLNITGLASGLYSLLTPMLALAGLAYVASPGATLASVVGFVKGADAFFMWQMVGGGLATLLPTMTYSLKKLADEGRLGDPVGKVLNVGLLAAAAGHLAVFGPMALAGQGGSMLPMVTGAWAAGGLAAVVGLFRGGAAKAVASKV